MLSLFTATLSPSFTSSSAIPFIGVCRDHREVNSSLPVEIGRTAKFGGYAAITAHFHAF